MILVHARPIAPCYTGVSGERSAPWRGSFRVPGMSPLIVRGDVDPGSRCRLVKRTGDLLTDDIALDPPGHDSMWMNADHRRGSVQCVGPPPDLDPAGLPRRRDIVDHDRVAVGFQDIGSFLVRSRPRRPMSIVSCSVWWPNRMTHPLARTIRGIRPGVRSGWFGHRPGPRCPRPRSWRTRRRRWPRQRVRR